MTGHRLLDAKFESGDIAREKSKVSGTRQVLEARIAVPPFLAPRELIVCCGAFVLTASLLACSASR